MSQRGRRNFEKKFCFGQNSGLGENPSYLRDEDSNSTTLSFWKLQIKVRKMPYVYLRKIIFPHSKRLKAQNAL